MVGFPSLKVFLELGEELEPVGEHRILVMDRLEKGVGIAVDSVGLVCDRLVDKLRVKGRDPRARDVGFCHSVA